MTRDCLPTEDQLLPLHNASLCEHVNLYLFLNFYFTATVDLYTEETTVKKLVYLYVIDFSASLKLATCMNVPKQKVTMLYNLNFAVMSKNTKALKVIEGHV